MNASVHTETLKRVPRVSMTKTCRVVRVRVQQQGGQEGTGGGVPGVGMVVPGRVYQGGVPVLGLGLDPVPVPWPGLDHFTCTLARPGPVPVPG